VPYASAPQQRFINAEAARGTPWAQKSAAHGNAAMRAQRERPRKGVDRFGNKVHKTDQPRYGNGSSGRRLSLDELDEVAKDLVQGETPGSRRRRRWGGAGVAAGGLLIPVPRRPGPLALMGGIAGGGIGYAYSNRGDKKKGTAAKADVTKGLAQALGVDDLKDLGHVARGRVIGSKPGEPPHEFRVKDGKMRPDAQMLARNLRTAAAHRKRGVALGAGGALVATGGTAYGATKLSQRQGQEVGKRIYDPEHGRQRREGAYEAGLLGTGATALGFGGHGVYTETRAAQTRAAVGRKLSAARAAKKTAAAAAAPAAAKKTAAARPPTTPAAVKAPAKIPGRLSRLGNAKIVVRGKHLGLIGTGLGALGGAGFLEHHGRSRGGRAYD
jgi:hypothetical protein